MSYKLVLEIPELPLTLNQLYTAHWRKKHQHSMKWKALVKSHLMGKEPKKPIESYHLKCTRMGSRYLDFDGLAASFKPAIDGLVEAGVLLDDGWKNTGPWELWQMLVPRAKSLIKIEVTEVVQPGDIGTLS